MPSQQLLTFNLMPSCGLMVLIWLVQVVIYPGFHRIAAEGFVEYHRWYVIRISVIVSPLMIAEALATFKWLLDGIDSLSMLLAALVLIVWLSTFLLQVPIHARLQKGKSEMLIRRLVATNWIRTVAWSLKALLVSLAVLRSGLVG
jgi:hypothetical protein